MRAQPIRHLKSEFLAACKRARTLETLEDPVLVVLGDSLTLVRNGKREESIFTPPVFHLIKTVAHIPVGVFVACRDGGAVRGLAAFVPELARLRSSVLAARPAADAETIGNLLDVLGRVEKFLRAALKTGTAKPGALAALAKSTGPHLLQCTRDATRLQLSALHSTAKRMLAPLDAQERSRLEVVVAGAHQARARSLPMQYFEGLLGEAAGAEVRLTYAEGVVDVVGALALAGTRRLDRAIAAAFFGDPRRLQRDVLGDAAKEQLARFAAAEQHTKAMPRSKLSRASSPCS